MDFKVRKHLIRLNRHKRNDNARSIEELKDNIGDSHQLDYDVAIADHHRDKPIVISQIKNDDGTVKDVVMIGKTGESHGAVTCTQAWRNLVSDKYNKDDEHWCQAYLLGNIAFVDDQHWAFIGYTQSDIVNILKQRPEIHKIYAIDKGHTITRLAKKVK